jgi:formyltetrahydrofolate-dependent phosphoribosylglycinamide formyltransferase
VLKKLQQKWKVKGLQLVFILLTFAIGGSLCGFIGRKILLFLNVDNKVLWLVLYILCITILWPLAVVVVSVPFGQFPFFKKYLSRVVLRVTGKKVIRIAIFASGNGSNAEKILTSSPPLLQKEKGVAKNEGEIIAKPKKFKVALIVCDKPGAGVLKIATTNNIPSLIIEKERFYSDGYLEELQKNNIDFIVLAGFLWKMPDPLITAYPGKIINIHPALLPKYGGKGMYGRHVHEAVIAAKEKESGITIHYVDEHYDSGDIIFQAKCAIEENDTSETLAKKIQLLEHEYYPKIINHILNK